jgi:hypothetical protein
LTAVGFAVLAAYDWWDAGRSPDVRVETADLVVNGIAAGTERVVEYVVANGGADPVRLVGAESC